MKSIMLILDTQKLIKNKNPNTKWLGLYGSNNKLYGSHTGKSLMSCAIDACFADFGYELQPKTNEAKKCLQFL